MALAKFANRGMLKKATSGVLAILSYSRTDKYAPCVKMAAALLDDFFDHSRQLLALNSSWLYLSFFRVIFNRPNRISFS